MPGLAAPAADVPVQLPGKHPNRVMQASCNDVAIDAYSGLRTIFSIDTSVLLHRHTVLDPDVTTPGCRNDAGSDKTRRNVTMATGTVKWFNTTKGFGFIAPDGGKKDVFVHISAVERSGLTGLRDEQKVTFDIETGRDGRESAINLKAQ